MHGRSGTAHISGRGLVPGPRRSFRSVTRSLAWTPRHCRRRRHLRVTWIEGAAPDSEEASVIRDAIVVRGLRGYGDIARRAADRLFRMDHAASGWIVDIGLFHATYLRHACDSLDLLHGRLVRIEDGASPWT